MRLVTVCDTSYMWKRGLDWAALALVWWFGVMWLGVVIFATPHSPLWLRLLQGLFGVFLIGWSCWKLPSLLRRHR